MCDRELRLHFSYLKQDLLYSVCPEWSWSDTATYPVNTLVKQPKRETESKFLHTVKASVFVGPCHHGMARPQVADGGTASDMEGSCE